MNADARVVVGYDGSPDSLAALGWAARTASLRGEAVVALTVIDPRETPRGVAWPESWWDEVEQSARDAVAAWPTVSLTFQRHTGHLIPTLVGSAADSSMLVVGSPGHGLVGDLVLGSVSQSAARHAPVPVVVVRPAQNPEAGRIVVGSDGSEASTRALDFACGLAETTGDKVVALHAWHPTTLVVDRYGFIPPPSTSTMADAEAAVRAVVEEARDAHPDVSVDGEVFQGAPERALVEASQGSSLVVVGTRGHTAWAGALMGSVSKTLLHKAHCPVAVIH